MKREAEYEQKYVKEVERRGALCPKLEAPGTPGYPDRMVLHGARPAAAILHEWLNRQYMLRGLPPVRHAREIEALAINMLAAAIVFVEFKTPGGAYQPRQRRVIGELRKRGFAVEVRRGDELTNE